MGNTYTVGAGLTLSQAIDDANADPGSTIEFNLSGTDTYTLSGDLPAISADVTIDGTNTTDGNSITIDGGGKYQGFYVSSGTATIEDLTLQNTAAIGQNGSAGMDGFTANEDPFPGGGGGGGGAGLGGGLLVGSQASVTLQNVAFESDSATGGNGGEGGTFGGTPSSSKGAGGSGGGAGGPGGGFEGGPGGQSGRAAPLPSSKGAGGSGVNGGAGGGGGFASGGGGGGAGIPSSSTKGAGGGAGGSGGAGGFGAGGGGGGGGVPTDKGAGGTGVAGGSGGFGAGAGSSGQAVKANGNSKGAGGTIVGGDGAGGGGLGAGGDIFVEQGGSLTIDGGSLTGGSVTGGAGGGNGAGNGDALGSGIFLQGDEFITLRSGAGQTTLIADVIADETAESPNLGSAGSGGVVIRAASGGVVELDAQNTYTGGTRLFSGTLDLAAPGAAGTGAIVFDGNATLQIDNAAFASGGTGILTFIRNTVFDFSVGDVINLTGVHFSSAAAPPTLSASKLLQFTENGTTYEIQFNSDLQVGGLHGAFFIASDGDGGTDIELAVGPVISGAGNTVQYYQSGAPILLDSGFTVIDPEGADITSATVTVSAAVSGDVLAFNNGTDSETFIDGATVTASQNGGVLTLTTTGGTATASDYQLALASVTYSSSGDPTGRGADPVRTVTWSVNDTNNQTSTSSSTLDVYMMPVLKGTQTPAPTVTPSSGAVTADTNLIVTDDNTIGTTPVAKVTISGGAQVGDELLIPSGDLTSGKITGTSITVTGNGTTTLTLIGISGTTVAQIQSALEDVEFDATTPHSGTRTLTWSFNDDAGGNANASNSFTTTVDAVFGPVIGATGNTVQYYQSQDGGAGTVLDGGPNGITLTDATVAEIAGATITIGTPVVGDMLVIPSGDLNGNTLNGTSIAVIGNGTATLALSGLGTAAEYQQALRDVTYTFGGGDPTDGSADPTRTITWSVTDANNQTSVGSSTTTLDVYMTPALAGTAMSTPTVTSTSGPVTADADLTITDSNDLGSAPVATVTITGGEQSGDELLLTADLSGTGITVAHGGTTSLTLTGTSSTTATEFQTALDEVQFDANTSDSGARTLTWQFNDDAGGNTNDSNSFTTNVGVAFNPTVATVPDPEIVTLSSSSPVTLTDTATLAGGSGPTGTITFTLFYNGGPNPVDTETVSVANGNGTYTTPTGYTLPTSGTVAGTYQWDATYSGDDNNNIGNDNNAVTEQVVVNPASPTLTTTTSEAVTFSNTVVTLSDSALLAGGYAPGGTITFTLVGPNSSYSDTVTVNGNGTYTTANGNNPGGFSLLTSGGASGTYVWHVSYSGDGNNSAETASPEQTSPTPVITAAVSNVNATASEVFAASSLFSASTDLPIITYEVEDESAGSSQGFWVLNGQVLPNGQLTTLTAAQLSELSFVAGAASTPVTDTLEVAASNAAGLGLLTTFSVTASAHASTAAPTVTAANVQQAPDLTLAASSLFSAAASGGNSIVSYEVEDTTPDSGSWMFNGTLEPTNQFVDVTATQLSELSFVTGYGSDSLKVRVNDGSQWSSFTSFTVTPPPNAAPPAGTEDTLVMLRNADGAFEFYDIGHNAILLDGPLGQINPALQVAGVGGFDGSDTADLLMRDPATEAFTLYDVSNNNITGNVALGQVGPEWTVSGVGDFSTRVGETDMLMRNSNSGAFEVYDISNNTITSAQPMGQVGLEWTVAGFGDFSGRANETDMLMRNSNTGAFEVYDISGNTIASAQPMGQVGLEWTIAGFGNFSGNANETDMLMRNGNTGVFELYDIRNNTIAATTPMGQVGLEWSLGGVSANPAIAPPSAQLSGPAVDPAAASLGQLSQAMASFAPIGAAPGMSSPIGQATSPAAIGANLLTTPNHA
jgi:hypothetical protein